jgi:predicted RNA methylase
VLDFSEVGNDWRIFRQSLRAWGVREALVDFYHYRRAKAHERSDRFDRRFGTETSRMVGIGNLDGAGPHGADAIHYWPTRESEFNQVMRAVGEIDHGDFTFVDLGCGKGRVVLLAAALPFKAVIGVDFSPALIERARQNIERYSGPVQASAVDVVVCDAAEFAIPDNDLVVYMFDPFGPRVLTKVLESLKSSLRASPRKAFLLYYSAAYPEVVREAGFRLVAEGRGENWPWQVYSAP